MRPLFRRRPFHLVLATTLLGSLALTAYRLTPPDYSLRSRVSRIRPGMSQAEVEAILGMPPGAYFEGEEPEPIDPLWVDRTGLGTRMVDDVTVQVAFDESGPCTWARYDDRKNDVSFQVPAVPWYRRHLAWLERFAP